MEFNILYLLILPIAIIFLFIEIRVTVKKMQSYKDVFFEILFMIVLLGVIITLLIPLFPKNIANLYIRYWRRPDESIIKVNIGGVINRSFPIEYWNILFLNELVYSMIINATRVYFVGIIPCSMILYLRKRVRLSHKLSRDTIK